MSNTVTRAELADAVYQQVGLSQQESGALVDLMFDLMADAVAKGEEVKITRLGTFQTRDKKARVGRNPKTMVEAEISARRVLSFRPSLLLKKTINDTDKN